MADQADRTREILKKVRQVEIHSRRFVDDALVGAYHSVFKGTGIDFSEVREYQPGDDVRMIDWNVTARMGKPFIKVFEEERELTIMLLVDLSGSLGFGSAEVAKRELAAELASVLAFSAIRNNDKVGMLLFTNEVESYIPPKKGRQHVLRLIREVLFFNPQQKGTNIAEALRTLNRLVKRRAICFLISDFITEDTLAWIRPSTTPAQDNLERILSVTSRRHDLICVEISDPRERHLPRVGIVTLEDAESSEQIEIDTNNERIRSLYAMQNQRRRESLRAQFRRTGVDSFTVLTEDPYIHSLRAFFKRRSSRR